MSAVEQQVGQPEVQPAVEPDVGICKLAILSLKIGNVIPIVQFQNSNCQLIPKAWSNKKMSSKVGSLAWSNVERVKRYRSIIWHFDLLIRGPNGRRLSEFVQISEFFSNYITDICQTSESFAKSVKLK